ncbi:MAG: hypothetical protein IT454_21515 [Planctomycetes bacterium]|nr:hypothetical protein [Planctomycetota bacterium]
MSRRILVTGCGRSGTGYFAALLSRLDIACGHEVLFHPEFQAAGPVAWAEDTPAESSWLAAPFLERLPNGTVVVHLVRQPELVLRSLWRIGLFRTRSIYRSFAEKHCRALQHGTPHEQTVKYWLRWNELVERSRDVRGLRYVRVRLDAVDESTVRWIGELAERDIDPALARRALAEVPLDTNTAGDRGQDCEVDWSALTGSPLRAQTEELAARYGFGPHALRSLLSRAA